MKIKHLFGISLTLFCTLAYSKVTASIDLSQTVPISPLIYGFNQDHEALNSPAEFQVRRLGGNRMSTFNWEENVENSGESAKSSWSLIASTIVGVLWNDRLVAGEAYKKFHQDNLDNNLTSIITVPILGWVAADANRTVSKGPNGADASRWNKLEYKKPTGFSITPDTTDRVVYLDESINFLVDQFGDASTTTGVKYISLGNEPGLWNTTHELLQDATVGIDEYIQKVILAATAVKDVDPQVKIIFGEFTGIYLYEFGNSAEWDIIQAANPDYNWVIDYFLEQLKTASDSYGSPLIDVLAFHNYPQHKIDTQGNFSSSGTVVRNSKSTQGYMRSARMDFPRSMWDSTYIEPSWLTNSFFPGEPHQILNRFDKSIHQYFPGIELMIGEFGYGDDTDISNGIAMTDLLGVFGANGLDIATRWDLDITTQGVYTHSAYKLFTNYDGQSSQFGNISIKSEWDNLDKASVWSSLDPKTNEVHIILINKELSLAQDFEVDLTSSVMAPVIKSVYGINGSSYDISAIVDVGALQQNKYSISLPAMSAYHVVISATEVSYVSEDNTTTLSTSSQASSIQTQMSHTQLSITGFEPGQLRVNITDLKGQSLMSHQSIQGSSSTVFDVSHLTEGLYFIEVIDEKTHLIESGFKL